MIADRLKQLRNYLDLNQMEFCKKIDISQSRYSAQELGKVTPSADVIEKIVTNLNVNANWLLTGDGDMFLADKPNTQSRLTPIKEVKQVGNSEVSYWMTENSKLWKMIEWLQGQNEILLAK